MNIFELLFPPYCFVCKRMGRYVCTACAANLPQNTVFTCLKCSKASVNGATHTHCKTRYTLNGYTSLYRYNSALKTILKQIKYKFVRKALSDLLEQSPIKVVLNDVGRYPAPVALVPIPLHESRLAWRGFNVAEDIAHALSKTSNLPVVNALKRTRSTLPQAETSSRQERKENIEGAFSALRPCSYKTVILVDDVITTGYTVMEAARELKKAGVEHVYAISLAKD